jgi:hypothetical protein
MANIIDETENLMILVLIFGAIGVIVFLYFKLKGSPDLPTPGDPAVPLENFNAGVTNAALSNVDWFDNTFGITAIETWLVNKFNLQPQSQPTQADAESWLNGSAQGVDPETQGLLTYINGGGQ